jgi:hypothetical protein
MHPNRILAHRGLWRTPDEKNSRGALSAALARGYGLETDVRDYGGRLVISHDPPAADALPLEALLDDYRRVGASGALALNIKSDGLAAPLVAMLQSYGITNYFVFDMSVPDMRHYHQLGVTAYSRHSDVETEIVGLDRSRGVWLDAFQTDWYDSATIHRLLASEKQVAVVSPELHGRDPKPIWKLLRSINDPDERLLCCTDQPDEFEKWMS